MWYFLAFDSETQPQFSLREDPGQLRISELPSQWFPLGVIAQRKLGHGTEVASFQRGGLCYLFQAFVQNSVLFLNFCIS